MITSVELSVAQPNWRWLKNPVHCVSLGFGCGLSPLAPGTVGTVGAVIIYGLIMYFCASFYLEITLVIIGVAIMAAQYTSDFLMGSDHRAIVIDEIAGFLFACINLPPSWFYLLLAFILFRVFDIAKPWPIAWLDRHAPGGMGIVADDLLAALYTLLIIQTLLFVVPP